MSEEEKIWEFISNGAETITRTRFKQDALRHGVCFDGRELDIIFRDQDEITFHDFLFFYRACHETWWHDLTRPIP